MRSRYTAFARGDAAYLLATWHPSTRPAELELEGDTVWRRLQLVDVVEGEEAGVVEFRASYRTPDGTGLLHERSRFAREGGRWFYVDGDLLD